MTEEVESSEEAGNSPAEEVVSRPDHVPEKFWDPETNSVRVDAALKSYSELEKRFGGFTGAPEKYDFSISDELKEKGVELDPENPLIQQFTEIAKEANMSPDLANKLVNMYLEGDYATSQSYEQAEAERVKQEIAALGKDGPRRLESIEKWASANLDPEIAEGLKEAAITSGAVKAIEALIQKTRNAPIASNDGPGPASITAAEIQQLQFAKDEHGNRRMQTDREYRKMVEAKMREFYGDGEHRITVG